jgi:hypothetical protein
VIRIILKFMCWNLGYFRPAGATTVWHGSHTAMVQIPGTGVIWKICPK